MAAIRKHRWSAVGREHEFPNRRFVEAKLGNQASHPSAVLEQPVGRVLVACTQSRMAAYGKRNVNGGLTAMNSKRWLTCPDPQETLALLILQQQVTDLKPPYRAGADCEPLYLSCRWPVVLARVASCACAFRRKSAKAPFLPEYWAAREVRTILANGK